MLVAKHFNDKLIVLERDQLLIPAQYCQFKVESLGSFLARRLYRSSRPLAHIPGAERHPCRHMTNNQVARSHFFALLIDWGMNRVAQARFYTALQYG